MGHFDPDLLGNISKAIWRTLRPQSCLSSDRGELVSKIESNIPFCPGCVCSYALARENDLSFSLGASENQAIVPVPKVFVWKELAET